MQIKNDYGYSAEQYKYQTGNSVCHILLGAGLQPHHIFDDQEKKYTSEVDAQIVEVYYEGKGTQQVKFAPDFKLPSIADFAKIELVNPRAYVRGRRIYVKADGIKAV